MSELGVAYINPTGGNNIWTAGTLDPVSAIQITAAQLNGVAHVNYAQTGALTAQAYVPGGTPASLAWLKFGPDSDGLYHDGTGADLLNFLNFTVLNSAVVPSGVVTPAGLVDNGGGLGNGSTITLQKNGVDLIVATKISDLATAYSLGITDLPTLASMTWGITAISFAGGATYIRLYSLPLRIFFTYDLPPPTEVDVTGSGGIRMGGSATRAFGAGAGPAAELHLKQWGLEAFTLDTDLEEHL